jgi:hypothetical protein
MKIPYYAINARGKVLGRGMFSSYGAAKCAADNRYPDECSAVLVDYSKLPRTNRVATIMTIPSDRENFPSWDAGR